jgi:hypothetical protein
MPRIDVADWRAACQYSGTVGASADGEAFGPTSPLAVWFWEVVEALPQAERALLLKFSTGSASVPAQGFERLMGLYGEQVCVCVKVERASVDVNRCLASACARVDSINVEGAEAEGRGGCRGRGSAHPVRILISLHTLFVPSPGNRLGREGGGEVYCIGDRDECECCAAVSYPPPPCQLTKVAYWHSASPWRWWGPATSASRPHRPASISSRFPNTRPRPHWKSGCTSRCTMVPRASPSHRGFP